MMLMQKNAFEWAQSAKNPHTEDAIRVTQSTANFFVRLDPLLYLQSIHHILLMWYKMSF